MRNYCRCDAVILDPWIMSDGLDLARWKENAHFLPLYLQQNDCWVSSDEITSWFFPHLHHWISILWVYIWTPLTRDQSRGDGARDPFHQACPSTLLLSVRTAATPSTSHIFSDLASSISHPCIACWWSFFNMQFAHKNILFSSYDLHFEYRLHYCVLCDETNKTRSHLHIFWRYFAQVATYM